MSHDPKAATIAAYDEFADAYAAAAPAMQTPELERALIEFCDVAGPSGRVLEIGSGSGRDARLIEARGLSVDRSDIAAGFVERLRRQGFEARLLDPLTDELGGPFDGVWAHASLLHVRRDDLPTVLRRLADATRPGGALHLALKEGDGERWSTHGSVTAPRHFTYWRADPLREVVTEAGWSVGAIDFHPSPTDNWLFVAATRV